MPGGQVWTVEEDEYIRRSITAHRSTADTVEGFYQLFGDERRTYAAILKRRVDLPNVRPSPSQARLNDEPRITPDAQDEPYRAPNVHWERAKEQNAAAIEFHAKRHKATVQLVSQKPVGFAFVSDQHISEGKPTNLDRMEADAKLIASTPGLYGVLGGDGVDNHIKHRAAIIASGSKPGDEWRLYDHYLGMFGHSLVAMISGNHDDWTKDFTDYDVVGSLAKKHRIFYAPDFVVLRLQLGSTGEAGFSLGQEYTAKVRHIYRYNSSFNPAHSVKRMWEMDDDDFDIGVLCHQHEAAMEPFVKHGLTRVAFRPGSYQVTSGHSRRYGFKNAFPTCPTAILLPDRREIIPFFDVRYAASYLTWLRAGWPDTGQAFVA